MPSPPFYNYLLPSSIQTLIIRFPHHHLVAALTLPHLCHQPHPKPPPCCWHSWVLCSFMLADPVGEPSAPPDASVCKLWQSIRFTPFCRCRQRGGTGHLGMFLHIIPHTPHPTLQRTHSLTHVDTPAQCSLTCRRTHTFHENLGSETLCGLIAAPLWIKVSLCHWRTKTLLN